MGRKGGPVADQPHFALPLEEAIVRQLPLRLGVRDRLARRPGGGAVGARRAVDDRGQAHRHPRPAEFGEGRRAATPPLLLHLCLAAADLVYVQVEVAIPVDGIHGQVQMPVDEQHVASLLAVMWR